VPLFTCAAYSTTTSLFLYYMLYSVKGRTLARRKPYKNNTRRLSNRATSKRVCKYKAITKELKHVRTNYNYKAKAKCKQATDKRLLNVEVIDYK